VSTPHSELLEIKLHKVSSLVRYDTASVGKRFPTLVITFLPVSRRPSRCLETSGTDCPLTRCHASKQRIPQLYRCRYLTRLSLYVYRNLEARSCNHSCRGKAVSITCSECVFIAFCIQHAMVILHIVICGLSGSTIFFCIF